MKLKLVRGKPEHTEALKAELWIVRVTFDSDLFTLGAVSEEITYFSFKVRLMASF